MSFNVSYVTWFVFYVPISPQFYFSILTQSASVNKAIFGLGNVLQPFPQLNIHSIE